MYMLTPGTKLNNRYEILKPLSGGGMGDAYLARDTWKEGENRCVVKQLKPDKVEPRTIRLFNNEAQTLCRLGSHDQIPELLAHFEQNDNFYLVQEFIQGHDLSEEISPNQPWSEARVIEFLEDILKILVFVHHNKVIHRDIKPSNIMRRNKDGKLVLIDFGGVKQVRIQENSTIATPVVGTYGYMPDEQIKNQAKLCSDIFAVGMVAIQASTGKQPSELFQMERDAKTGQFLWHNYAKLNASLARILYKMVQFHHELRYQAANEALEAVINLSLTVEYWLDNVSQFIQEKDYHKAAQACQQAINVNSNSYTAWYYHGIILRKLGQNDNAVLSYDQAIRIQPLSSEAWYSRGLVLDEMARDEDALASFDKAIQLKPDYAQAWVCRGTILNKQSRYNIALASFGQAIQYQPDNTLAWAGRGWTLNCLQRYLEALACFNEAIKIQPNNPETWYSRGIALANLEKYEDAVASYKQAVKIKSNYYQAWYSLGIVLEKLGKNEDAMIYYDRALQIQPNDADIWNSRGVTLMTLKKYDEALVSFKQALNVKPDHEMAIDNSKKAENKLRKPSFLRWL